MSLRALKSPWHTLGGKCASQGSVDAQPLEGLPFPEISPDNAGQLSMVSPGVAVDLEKEHHVGRPRRRMLH